MGQSLRCTTMCGLSEAFNTKACVALVRVTFRVQLSACAGVLRTFVCTQLEAGGSSEIICWSLGFFASTISKASLFPSYL